MSRGLAPATLILAGGLSVLAFTLASGVFDRPQVREPGDLEPFVGVTTDGTVVPGLFSIRASGVSTAPVRAAAERFLDSLTPRQRSATLFPVDSDEWRRWHNIHRYDRRGVSRRQMNDAQDEAALDLLRASLSTGGFAKSRDIMRLNGVLADLVDDHEEYGEDLYFFTVMGEPSRTQPWGWQLDGHHLVINYFVLGDQVVMTPAFMGSEPVRAESGPHAGTRVFGPEEEKGLAFIQTLTSAQRQEAMVAQELPPNVFTAAFRDNFEMRYEGIRAGELDGGQRSLLLDLIREYVGNLRDGHAGIRMREVERHLDDTWFSWRGATDDDAVFYYRVHSPVLLIEFDHQDGVALETDGITRNHVHSVVRTPNGNDYGKDLLRRHHERFAHVDGRHVPRSSEPAESSGR